MKYKKIFNKYPGKIRINFRKFSRPEIFEITTLFFGVVVVVVVAVVVVYLLIKHL